MRLAPLAPQENPSPDAVHPGPPQDITKPFYPRCIYTDSSKYHRNTQYMKLESTCNTMRKVTNTLPLQFPAQQASCCSHHYILFSTLQGLCNLALTLDATLTTPNRKQMLTCISTSFSPCCPTPSPPINTDTEGVGDARQGKVRLQRSCGNKQAWDWQSEVVRLWCL